MNSSAYLLRQIVGGTKGPVADTVVAPTAGSAAVLVTPPSLVHLSCPIRKIEISKAHDSLVSPDGPLVTRFRVRQRCEHKGWNYLQH